MILWLLALVGIAIMLVFFLAEMMVFLWRYIAAVVLAGLAIWATFALGGHLFQPGSALWNAPAWVEYALLALSVLVWPVWIWCARRA